MMLSVRWEQHSVKATERPSVDLLVAGLIIIILLLGSLLIFARPKKTPVRHPPKPAPPVPVKPPVQIPQRGLGISLLVPYKSDSGVRQDVWQWLREYWTNELPGAQICMGTDWETPFCKTAAVNRAGAQAGGDIMVILDADCYISGEVILGCADRIRQAGKENRKVWFIPYRNFYRLTEEASNQITSSDSKKPYRPASPPPETSIIRTESNSPTTGHWWGALIQIMPREAFAAAGGMDERFAGWGGEDVSFMRAVDTLWAKHKTTPNDVLHLWHPTTTSAENPYLRVWQGQDSAHVNDSLEGRYQAATGDRAKMSALTKDCRWGKPQDVAEAETSDPSTEPIPAVTAGPKVTPPTAKPANSGLDILWPQA